MHLSSLDIFNPDSFEKLIGTVIATQNSPSTTKIDFVLSNNAELEYPIAIGEFVEIQSDRGLVIAVLTEIYKTNAYFSNPNVAKDSLNYKPNTNHVQQLFPTNEWATTIASLKPLAFLSVEQSNLQRVKYPISPGNFVHKCRSSIVEKFLGLDKTKSGLYLGDIRSGNGNTEIPLIIDPEKLFHKHLAILAISGAGKSYATSILLEELLIRPFEKGRLPVIIIDPHGEYKQFSSLLDQPSLASVYPGKHLSIQTDSLKSWNFKEFAPEISSVQVREIDKILQVLRADQGSYSFKDLIDKISSDESIPSRTKESLLGWLYGLQKTKIFGINAYPDLEDIVKPGKISIFDLSDIQSLRIKQIICAYLAKKMLFLRRQKKISPFLLIIEEAHQFCPENGLTISKGILETIAREGRKFFASLCLISQRPVNLSSTALSQCNTHLIMRIRNPYDLDYIGRLSEGIDRETQKMLPDLEVGEGILVGEAVNYPVLFKVRKKKLNLGKNDFDLTTEIKNYELR